METETIKTDGISSVRNLTQRVKMGNFDFDLAEFSSIGKFAHGVDTNVTQWSLIGITVFMFFFKVLLHKRQKHQDNKLIKFEDLCGPPGLPLIGPALKFLPIEKTLYNMLDISKQYGACFSASFFNEKSVVLNSPELVQSFLKSGDMGHVTKSPFVYDLMKPFIVNGVLVSKGTFWKSERKILSRFLFMSNLKKYFPMLQKHASRFVSTLEKLSKEGQPHPINDPVNTSFLEIITEFLTGADVYGTKMGLDYHHNFETWKSTISYRSIYPWLLLNVLWKLHPMQQKQLNAINAMTRFSKERLAECKAKRLMVKQSEKITQFQTMIDAMLDADASDEQIIDELNTMMFGGHDTTAATIQFFFLLMALNPHHQELCRNEVDHVFNTTNGQLCFEKLFELKYLERCIYETLRIFPVVIGFFRKLESPLNIDYNSKTLCLEPGINVFVPPWFLHHNPEYFPNPSVFDPDRFLPEECAKRHSHAFLPFSAGPRNCLGIKFAMMQLKTVAAHVFRKFEVTTTEKIEDITLLSKLTLVPKTELCFTFRMRR